MRIRLNQLRGLHTHLLDLITRLLTQLLGMHWFNCDHHADQAEPVAGLRPHLLDLITRSLTRLLGKHWFNCNHHADQAEPVAWLAHTSA